jgi:hypothetical protein
MVGVYMVCNIAQLGLCTCSDMRPDIFCLKYVVDKHRIHEAHLMLPSFFPASEAPYYTIQYKLDSTLRIRCWLIKCINLEISRYLRNPAGDETDVKGIMTVYCMHIFRVHLDFIVPVEEIMVVIHPVPKARP